jgi:hypothetical protein
MLGLGFCMIGRAPLGAEKEIKSIANEDTDLYVMQPILTFGFLIIFFKLRFSSLLTQVY